MKTPSRLAALSLSSLSLLAVVGALASTTIACGESSGTDDTSGTDSGVGADAGSDATACSNEGTGSIAIVVSGLPDGVTPKGAITGPSGTAIDVTGPATLADQPAGTYTVAAERVAKADPIVRTLYEPTVSSESFCLAGTQTQTVTITYSEIASSNKLWATNANNASGQLLAFAGADLTATGAPAATVKTKGASGQGAHAGTAVAFDKDGNLWSLGATTADAPLLRFAAADLGASGDKTPDRKINPKLSGCSPGVTAIAFAPDGSLWSTVTCSDQILRLSPDTLSTSKDYTPDAEDFATGAHNPRGIAFDKTGNMWVSDATTIHLYPSASLAPGQPHVPSFSINVKTLSDAGVPPDALAFDKDGNLWVTSFGSNTIFKLTPDDLAPADTSKTVVPSISISIDVSALLESLAFDEGGGMWLTFGQGKLARLAPSQLGTSSDPGSPTAPETVITSADVGAPGGLAFFPAPAALPLYGHFE